MTASPPRSPSPRASRWPGWLLGLALSGLGTQAAAVHLVVLEEQFHEGPIINNFRINDALADEPKPYLRIYPEKDDTHRKFVEILSAGMPFDLVNVRNQVAEVLQGFPDVCKPYLGVAMVVGPIGHIDHFVPGVKDKRRILHMYIGNCLAQDLPACEYDIDQTGDVDFGIGMYLTVLRECRDATNEALRNGAALMDWAAQKSPASSVAAPAP